MNIRSLFKTTLLAPLLVPLFVAAVLIPVAHADFKEDILALCDKMQACVLEELETNDLPPEVKELLTKKMFEQQCALAEKYEKEVNDFGLEAEAKACVDSLLNKDCATSHNLY